MNRILEVAVFAPVGVALTLRDMAPTFVNMFVSRGRAEVDRRQHHVEQRVQTMKSTGEVALAFGVPMVRSKVEAALDQLRGRDVSSVGNTSGDPTVLTLAATNDVDDADNAPGALAAPDSRRNGHEGSRLEASSSSNGAADLAIPGYDALAASQVVERLVGLSVGELDAVRDYESQHRNRRTILGKIAQLTEA